jgi:hypothetical protein
MGVKIVIVVRFLTSATIIFVLFFGLLFLADLAGINILPHRANGGHILAQGAKISFSPCLTYSSPFKIPAFVLVLAFLRVGLFCAGSLILFWLLDLFEAGEFFTAQIVHYINPLGWLVLVDWVLIRVLDAVAHRFSPDTVGLAGGLLIVLTAWIMDEARKIQEEQDLTV